MLCACVSAPAFELGSCLIVHIGDPAAPATETASVTVVKEVLETIVVEKPKTSANVTDFLADAKESSFITTEDTKETDSLATSGSFTFEEPKSGFEISPFETSAFTLE